MRLKAEIKFQSTLIDKLKIAMIEFDRHVRDSVVANQEFMIQQLETENAHLRKMLLIPEDLFTHDPEEEKKKEADKKKNMLKSIDEKLKQAEKKIAKKQSASDIYMQQQREHGFDPFELDAEDYDIYRMSKLKEQAEMPKEMRELIHSKIYGKIEERNYRDEMRRQHEKEILEEFARAYGYDVNKHQPHNNNGEIDVEYLQAFVAECRAREERMAKEQALAKQKEALKGKMAGTVNKSNKTKTAPAPKKQLTVETEHQKVEKSSKTEKLLDAPEQPQLMNEEPPLGDDDFDRDEDEAPMSKDRLEKESSNSVSSLQRLQNDELGNEEKENM